MTRLIKLVRITGEAWLSSRLILAGSRENLSLPSESTFLEERRGGSGIDRLSEAMLKCRQRAKGVKDFFVLTYPQGGREIVSKKREDNGKREIATEQTRGDSSREQFCVAGNIFFLNSRKGSLAV